MTSDGRLLQPITVTARHDGGGEVFASTVGDFAMTGIDDLLQPFMTTPSCNRVFFFATTGVDDGYNPFTRTSMTATAAMAATTLCCNRCHFLLLPVLTIATTVYEDTDGVDDLFAATGVVFCYYRY